jgi:thiamine biosynthesis protein ThiI
MANPAIVVHYHELWLKGKNRKFFLGKLIQALRRALEGVPVERFELPGDRILVRLGGGAQGEEVTARLAQVFGIAYYAIARPVARELEAIARAAWEEVAGINFSTFAVRAKRSDKTFPQRAAEIEAYVGRYLLDQLARAGRTARVRLDEPELTCRIEITTGPALVYARKIPGPGGLPANTAGRLGCLLSGGFDSAVAGYKMMKRGAHLVFIHFYGTGARPGESSVHVARALVKRLVPWQGNARLYLVPFEPIQRAIVQFAPQNYRVLLYRRMMLRIAEELALRCRAAGLVTGDSLGQVASQTLQNLAAVEAAARLPVFRPLVGDDKQEILALARKVGTYEISAEPFHDCCPVFLPRTPALHATAPKLEEAEARLDLAALVASGVQAAALERYRYTQGRVEQVESQPTAKVTDAQP